MPRKSVPSSPSPETPVPGVPAACAPAESQAPDAPASKKPASKKPAAKKRKRAKVMVDGHPIYVSGKTKRELEEKKRLVRERYIGGVKPREMTFHSLVIEWFETFKRPHIRTESTLKNWRNAINNHVLPCFPPHQMVQAVRRADLQRCVDQTKGYSYLVTDLVCAVIRYAFDYAISEGMVVVDPSRSLIKPDCPPRSEKEPLTLEQEDALLLTASRHPDGLMLYLLYYLGIRRGEMLGLRWEDFDFKAKTVHIQRDIDFNLRSSSMSAVGDLKTRAANRIVPVPDELIDILSPLRSLPHLYLISDDNGDPLTPNLYHRCWMRLMKDAGYLEPTQSYLNRVERWKASGQKVYAPNLYNDYRPVITAHRFRHHYITSKVLAGERPEIIMAIVGHADYSTTINVYTHIKNRIGVEPTRLAKVFMRYVA